MRWATGGQRRWPTTSKRESERRADGSGSSTQIAAPPPTARRGAQCRSSSRGISSRITWPEPPLSVCSAHVRHSPRCSGPAQPPRGCAMKKSKKRRSRGRARGAPAFDEGARARGATRGVRARKGAEEEGPSHAPVEREGEATSTRGQRQGEGTSQEDPEQIALKEKLKTERQEATKLAKAQRKAVASEAKRADRASKDARTERHVRGPGLTDSGRARDSCLSGSACSSSIRSSRWKSESFLKRSASSDFDRIGTGGRDRFAVARHRRAASTAS